MSLVPVRDLRNNTAAVIERARTGENVTITVNGVPVATLNPIAVGKRSSLTKQELLEILKHPADAGLRDDLARLAGDTTDDLGLIK